VIPKRWLKEMAEKGKVNLSNAQWEEATRKGGWVAKDVPADGMCGWFSLLLATGKIQDTAQYRDPATGSWTAESIAVLGGMFRGLCSLFKTYKKDKAMMEHMKCGMPGMEMTVETATSLFQAAQAYTNQGSVPPMENQQAWLSEVYMNMAAVYFGRIIVVATFMNQSPSEDQCDMYFSLFSPVPIPGYSSTDTGGIPTTGTHYPQLDDLRKAVEDVMGRITNCQPPVCLVFYIRNKHYGYYMPRPTKVVINMGTAKSNGGKQPLVSPVHRVQHNVLQY